MAVSYATWGWAGSGYGERIYLEVWHSGVNTAGNYSNFGYKIYNNSHDSFGSTGNISWTLRDQWGQRASGSRGPAATSRYNQRIDYASGSFRIDHNGDGTMPNINFTLSINRGLGNIKSANVKVTVSNVPNIARHSSINVPGSFTLGNEFTVSFDRQHSSFFHYVDIKHNGKMMWSKKVETSASVVIDRNEMLDRVPNANSATLNLVYTTRTSNGTEIGRSSRNITCNLNAPGPSIGGISHSEANSSATAMGGYVQSKSRLKISMTGVSPGRGARITSSRITIDGQVLNAQSGTTQVINKSGSVPIVATVTDSRGKSASRTVSASVLAYKPPVINSIKAFRANSNGTSNDYGTYVKFEIKYSITSLNSKNTRRIKVKVGSNDSWVTLPDYGGTHTVIYGGFDVNKPYTYNISLQDHFGTTVSTSVIPTGAVTMMWGRDWISVGTAEGKGSGTLNVKSDIYQRGKRVLDFNTTPDTNGGTQNFNNFWKAGAVLYTSSANATAAPNSPKLGAGRLVTYTNGDYSNASQSQAWLYSTQVFTTLGGQVATRNFSTNGNGKGSWSSWKKLLREDDVPNPIKDHVIETGSNSKGQWRKWSSGRMEQWGTMRGSWSVETAMGSGYRALLDLYFPTKFPHSAESITVTGNNYVMTSTGGDMTADWAPIRLMSFDKGRKMGTLYFHVHGRWK